MLPIGKLRELGNLSTRRVKLCAHILPRREHLILLGEERNLLARELGRVYHAHGLKLRDGVVRSRRRGRNSLVCSCFRR